MIKGCVIGENVADPAGARSRKHLQHINTVWYGIVCVFQWLLNGTDLLLTHTLLLLIPDLVVKCRSGVLLHNQLLIRVSLLYFGS